MGERILVLGGSGSGKSLFAQKLARDAALREKRPLYYLATMRPFDAEDCLRIKRHRRVREGWGFDTIEEPLFLSRARCGGGVVLLDSLTALLTNRMFSPEGEGVSLEKELSALTETAFLTVLVSDMLFSDSLFYDPQTEEFRRRLGHLHQSLAKSCKTVYRLSCGVPEVWKGEEA